MLQTVAKDVKVQVEWNHDVVARYRLLGYENRAVRDEEFRNDEVDGGEVGAGHTVTALYEGKREQIPIPRDLVEVVRDWVDQEKALQELLSRISELHTEMIRELKRKRTGR